MISRTVVVLLLGLGVAGAVQAGTVYRWTDANGVVHFADVPPPSVWTYSTETLPAAARRQPPPAAVASASGDTAAADPSADAKASGPAQLVIIDREQASLGGWRQSFSGKVKNKGGAVARDVTVAIRVIEPTQGDECIDDKITISASTLAPGESATFTADYDNPCFAGPTDTEIRVEWN